MTFSFLLRATFLLLIVIPISIFAQEYSTATSNSTSQITIKIAPPDLSKSNSLNTYLSAEELSGYKTISLINIPQLTTILKENNASIKSSNDMLDTNEDDEYFKDEIKPLNIDIGMNGVPVLDQGPHGTCVTFATTAALDAIIGKGDYIDQQCALELFPLDLYSYSSFDMISIVQNGYYWNGAAYPSQIIYPLLSRGVVRKNECYGAIYPHPYDELESITQYTDISDKTALKKVKSATFYKKTTIWQVKRILNKGKRALAAVLISEGKPAGFDFKINNRTTTAGLWACKHPQSPGIDFCKNSAGAHEILIIGYDDKQRLLKVRNSWGSNVGDYGDFYMTYTYFNRMKMNVTEINEYASK